MIKGPAFFLQKAGPLRSNKNLIPTAVARDLAA